MERVLMELFDLAEQGKLTDVDTDEYKFQFYELASQDVEAYKMKLKKFRQSLTNFCSRFETTILDVETNIDSWVKKEQAFKKKKAALPEYGTLGDDDGTLKFIKGLKRDLYNYSQAADTLGCITRQTLTKEIRAGYLGIKHVIKGKTEYITKEDLIRIHRDKFPSDFYGLFE